jgi:predicted transcriptional regulator YdeE
MMSTNADNQVQLIELPEIKLVGVYIASGFTGQPPKGEDALKASFHRRKAEIRNPTHPGRYLSPHFTCEVLFTYLICLEVSEFADVPEGMVYFTVPAHRYAAVQSAGDPYEVIHTYLRNNGHHKDEHALALEMYQFDNPRWPDAVEVLLPLR